MTTTPRSIDFWESVKKASMFFEGRAPVHKSLRRLVRRLEKARISYVVICGMAVNAHGYERTTNDVDILVTPEGLEEFRKRFVPKNYEQHPKRSRRFTDKTNQVTVDVLVTGMTPGFSRSGPLTFPDPDEVRERVKETTAVNLPTLIQLKLAARRYRDFGDVVELIRANNLDESFLDQLHESVRQDFIECLEEKRREDEYEERNG